MPLLVPLLEMKTSLRSAILILFPGLYLLAALLFAVTLCVWKCLAVVRERKERERDGYGRTTDETEELLQGGGIEDLLDHSHEVAIIN